jgi:hypothetical protein
VPSLRDDGPDAGHERLSQEAFGERAFLDGAVEARLATRQPRERPPTIVESPVSAILTDALEFRECPFARR